MPAIPAPFFMPPSSRAARRLRPAVDIPSSAAPKGYLARVPRTGDDDADYEAGQELADRIRSLMLDRQDVSMLRDIVIGMIERGTFGMVEAGFMDEIALAAMF
jgi:hypothetical protein